MMSPRSSSRTRPPRSRAHAAASFGTPLVPVALALTFAVALALAAALAAAPADARSRGGTVQITTDSRHDTTQVKEITIDDEGIRIVGGTKGEVRMPIPP